MVNGQLLFWTFGKLKSYDSVCGYTGTSQCHRSCDVTMGKDTNIIHYNLRATVTTLTGLPYYHEVTVLLYK